MDQTEIDIERQEANGIANAIVNKLYVVSEELRNSMINSYSHEIMLIENPLRLPVFESLSLDHQNDILKGFSESAEDDVKAQFDKGVMDLVEAYGFLLGIEPYKRLREIALRNETENILGKNLEINIPLQRGVRNAVVFLMFKFRHLK